MVLCGWWYHSKHLRARTPKFQRGLGTQLSNQLPLSSVPEYIIVCLFVCLLALPTKARKDIVFRFIYIYATYIFTAPTCTTTIISLKPSALNAEYQHFILR
jgi:hypothetical protein